MIKESKKTYRKEAKSQEKLNGKIFSKKGITESRKSRKKEAKSHEKLEERNQNWIGLRESNQSGTWSKLHFMIG